jgi:hypothetical protein
MELAAAGNVRGIDEGTGCAALLAFFLDGCGVPGDQTVSAAAGCSASLAADARA